MNSECGPVLGAEGGANGEKTPAELRQESKGCPELRLDVGQRDLPSSRPLSVCHGPCVPEEGLGLRREGSLSRSPPRASCSRLWEAWHPQHQPFLDGYILCLHSWALLPALASPRPPGQAGTACAGFQLSGWGSLACWAGLSPGSLSLPTHVPPWVASPPPPAPHMTGLTPEVPPQLGRLALSCSEEETALARATQV